MDLVVIFACVDMMEATRFGKTVLSCQADATVMDSLYFVACNSNAVLAFGNLPKSLAAWSRLATLLSHCLPCSLLLCLFLRLGAELRHSLNGELSCPWRPMSSHESLSRRNVTSNHPLLLSLTSGGIACHRNCCGADRDCNLSSQDYDGRCTAS